MPLLESKQNRQGIKIKKEEKKNQKKTQQQETINRHQTSDKLFKQNRLLPNHNDGSL